MDGEYKSGSVNISGAWIFAPRKNAHALSLGSAKYDAILNDVHIGNGTEDKWVTGENDKQAFACIANSCKGTTKITGQYSRIYGGPYGASAITKYDGGKLELLDNTYIYATNKGDSISPAGRFCVNAHDNGATIIFNSTGNFFATGYYVGNTEKNISATFSVKKGSFGSRHNKYMIQSNGKETVPATDITKKNLNFYHMTGYDSTGVESIAECYKLDVNV